MNKFNTVGIDLAKNVFQVHINDPHGKKLSSKQIKRNQLLNYLVQQPESLVAMEACCGAHYWAREIRKLGHQVKVIHPSYVKPFVQLHKNDQRDAAAICEAAVRPNIPAVAVKSAEQMDLQAIHRVRERVVKERTAIGNELRGILLEAGITIAQGVAALRSQVPLLLEDAENGISHRLRLLIQDLMDQWRSADDRAQRYKVELEQIATVTPLCKLLMKIPGIGPINATLLLSHAGDAKHFKSSRHFSAYLGLVPRQYASGGKEQLGGITKHGNGHVRKQLVHGARSAYRSLLKEPQSTRLGRWLAGLEGKHPNKIIIALANKLARIIWVVLSREVAYQAN